MAPVASDCGHCYGTHRCETPTLLEGHRGHYPGLMLAGGCACRTSGVCRTHNAYNRKPRDAKQTQDVIMNAMSVAGRRGPGLGWGAAVQMTKPLAVWPQRCALSRLPGFSRLLQVLYDSLHVLDGGVTMRLLILVGCHVFDVGKRAAIELANERLAALPRHDEFTHFDRPLFGLTPKAKGNIRAIQMTVNWRCMEYEQLIAQVMYLLPTWSDATSMLIAWAELYQHLRFVAPTKQSIQRTFQLYTPCPPPNIQWPLFSRIPGYCDHCERCRQVQAMGEPSRRRMLDGNRRCRDVRAEGACSAPLAGGHAALGGRGQRPAEQLRARPHHAREGRSAPHARPCVHYAQGAGTRGGSDGRGERDAQHRVGARQAG